MKNYKFSFIVLVFAINPVHFHQLHKLCNDAEKAKLFILNNKPRRQTKKVR